MALPVLPADGDNPWGAALRSALTDISNRADQGITAAQSAQSELDGVALQVNSNNTTLTSYGNRITNLETSNATKALDSVVVKLSGNQTIAGTKTFSAAPVVPDNSFAISAISGLQTALNSKATLDSPTFTGTVSGLDKTMVGLANADNTTDLLKPVSTATQNALNLKANTTDLTSAIQTHNHTGGTAGVNIPITAVSGLQDQINTFTTNINGKQASLRSTTAGASAITYNTAWFTQNITWLYRFGPIAYIFIHVTLHQTIGGGPTGNIANSLIGTINSTNEFSHIYQNTAGNMTYSLSTTDTGIAAAGYIDAATGKIQLSAVGSSQDLQPNYEFTLAGTFLLDNIAG